MCLLFVCNWVHVLGGFPRIKQFNEKQLIDEQHSIRESSFALSLGLGDSIILLLLPLPVD